MGETLCEQAADAFARARRAEDLPSLKQIKDAGKNSSSNSTHSPLGSSFWGLPYRILNINPKKELLRGLWVVGGGLFRLPLIGGPLRLLLGVPFWVR